MFRFNTFDLKLFGHLYWTTLIMIIHDKLYLKNTKVYRDYCVQLYLHLNN